MAQQTRDLGPPSTPRSARQWLLEFGWVLVEPTEQDLADLDRVMHHDEFWDWSSGKVEIPGLGNTTRRQAVRDGIILALFYAGISFIQIQLIRVLP